jgi:hypothetical protein
VLPRLRSRPERKAWQKKGRAEETAGKEKSTPVS